MERLLLECAKRIDCGGHGDSDCALCGSGPPRPDTRHGRVWCWRCCCCPVGRLGDRRRRCACCRPWPSRSRWIEWLPSTPWKRRPCGPKQAVEQHASGMRRQSRRVGAASLTGFRLSPRWDFPCLTTSWDSEGSNTNAPTIIASIQRTYSTTPPPVLLVNHTSSPLEPRTSRLRRQ